jgi:indolepyruvate ferredoxin oxidoreductase beta subunit
MAVAIGEAEYPQLKIIEKNLSDLSHEAWYLDASGKAIALGAPLLSNMVMAGALIGSGWVPLEEEAFERRLKMTFKMESLSSNLEAFRLGVSNIRKQIWGMVNK